MPRPKGFSPGPETRARQREGQLKRYNRDGRVVEGAGTAAEYHRVYKMQRRYGITVVEYERLLRKQSGGCAICGGPPKSGKTNFSIDHDHETGEVRGLLCQPCNLALGHLEENIEAAFRYLGGDD